MLLCRVYLLATLERLETYLSAVSGTWSSTAFSKFRKADIRKEATCLAKNGDIFFLGLLFSHHAHVIAKVASCIGTTDIFVVGNCFRNEFAAIPVHNLRKPCLSCDSLGWTFSQAFRQHSRCPNITICFLKSKAVVELSWE